MKNYFEELDKDIKEYFDILSGGEIPEFLIQYINTPEMQKQKGISVTCACYYTKMFKNINRWYSSLEHSVAVALIIWHFTKDKKQTLAGLFHDIATPCFKHCIDFLNGDYEKQESTEELTTEIIANSKEIMKLLEKDNIRLEEVDDYKIYPIADNDTPKLSADRLEYTFSNGLGVRDIVWNLEGIRKVYEDIEVQKDEDGIQELGFKNIELAEKFVHNMSILSMGYLSNKVKFSMQFLADVVKKLNEKNIITMEDLYELSEKDIIDKIEKSNDDNLVECFEKWRNAKELKESEQYIKDKYCLNIKAKMRYIVPLVRKDNEFVRINEISNSAKEEIENVLNYKTKKYAYLDFKL